MKLDQQLFIGTHNGWHWAVSCEIVRHLDHLVTKFFEKHYLCIVTFDSGSISPGPEELAIGWSTIGEVMLSPPLQRNLHIPADEYDEWYVFDRPPHSFPKFDRFVNYLGFNLADPRKMAESIDSTWTESSLDWLQTTQDRFWKQLDEIDPVAYIGSGDNDIVVSKQAEFVESFVNAAHSPAS